MSEDGEDDEEEEWFDMDDAVADVIGDVDLEPGTDDSSEDDEESSSEEEGWYYISYAT